VTQLKPNPGWGQDTVIIHVYDGDGVLLFDRSVIEEVAREEAEKIASTLFPGYMVQWCTTSGEIIDQVVSRPPRTRQPPDLCPWCWNPEVLITMEDENGPLHCAHCFAWRGR